MNDCEKKKAIMVASFLIPLHQIDRFLFVFLILKHMTRSKAIMRLIVQFFFQFSITRYLGFWPPRKAAIKE
jgi:hypothetical protein